MRDYFEYVINSFAYLMPFFPTRLCTIVSAPSFCLIDSLDNRIMRLIYTQFHLFSCCAEFFAKT